MTSDPEPPNAPEGMPDGTADAPPVVHSRRSWPVGYRLHRGSDLHDSSWPWPQRLAVLLFGAALPAGCLLLTSVSGDTTCQPGTLARHAELLLTWRPSMLFYPLVLYSMMSLVTVVVRPERIATQPWSRFGVFTGVLLALHYFVLVFVIVNANAPNLLLPMLLVSVLAGETGVWFISSLARSLDDKAMAVVVIVSVGLMLFLMPLWPFTPISMGVFVAPWALTAYCMAAWRSASETTTNPFRFTLAQLLALVTWFAVYLAALRTAMLIATAS